MVEVGNRLVDLVQWVEGGGQIDLAFPCERHQLRQVGVGADQVTDDALLAENHVDRRHLNRAAIPDDVIGPRIAGHREALIDGSALAHKVDHGFGALLARELKHIADRVVAASHQVLGSQFLREAQRQARAVHDDDLRRALFPEDLVRDVAKATEPDDHRDVAGLKTLGGLVGHVIRGEAGVGVGGDLLRGHAVGKANEVALLDLEVLRKSAIAGDAGERPVLAMHVVAPAARRAGAVGDERVHDHCVALLETTHFRPHLLHPAGVLVARNVGELNADLVAPHALDDVQVGPAEPRAPDPNDHVICVLQLGVPHVFQLEELGAVEWWVVLVEPRGFHSTPLLTTRVGSAWSGDFGRLESVSPYRVLSRPRQKAALNSTERRVRCACASSVRNTASSMGRPSGRMKAGASASPTSPRSLRIARYRSASSVPSRLAARPGRSPIRTAKIASSDHPSASRHRTSRSCRARNALTRKVSRSSPRFSVASWGNVSTKVLPQLTPLLISSSKK